MDWFVGVILRDREHQSKPEPRLGVQERFFCMFPLPLLAFNTLLVHSLSLDSQQFVFLSQKLSRYGRVWHEKTVDKVSVYAHQKDETKSYRITAENPTVTRPKKRKMI